jgi:hypothetical protein
MCRQWDDETGQPTRLSGFDESQPTAFNMGKIRAISKIREDNPYNTVVMIGGTSLDNVCSCRAFVLLLCGCVCTCAVAVAVYV